MTGSRRSATVLGAVTASSRGVKIQNLPSSLIQASFQIDVLSPLPTHILTHLIKCHRASQIALQVAEVREPSEALRKEALGK